MICVYDDNNITIEGSTDIAFTEDVVSRFRAYNWHVVEVDNGNDLDAIDEAFCKARDEKERPSLIALRTHIAYGSPNKQDTSSAHGEPLGEEEVLLTKKNLDWPTDTAFFVPEEVLGVYRKSVDKGGEKESEWQTMWGSYRDKYPELAQKWSNFSNNIPREGWDDDLPGFSSEDGPIATRAASGKVLNNITSRLENMVGGSADLAPSNKTLINESHDFQKDAYDGRNVRFGVREHAMAAILSGIAIHKGLIPYGGTFLVFSDYMRPSIRLASLMRLQVIYVFTHDSIAVGEDGPTHQPIEHLLALRAIPGLTVIRPADANETLWAWREAIKNTKGPTALMLSRQKLPIIDRTSYPSAEGLTKGAYILLDSKEKPELIIIGTGSEVHICLEASKILTEKGIRVRVVNMPSWELFEQSPKEYRDSVLIPDVRARIVVETGVPIGWERYTGDGLVIGIDRFGASAPGNRVMEEFGFTAENIVNKAMELLAKNSL
jgi:transketolase